MTPNNFNSDSRAHDLVQLSTRAVSGTDARAFEAYVYPPPYDLYNSAPGSAAAFLEPEHRYVSVVDQSRCLWGFGCIGEGGQVPGGTYTTLSGALDIGLGMAPDRVSRGFGPAFALAILHHACSPETKWFRVSVAAFNERSIRLWHSLGFAERCSFTAVRNGLPFIQMVARPAELELAPDGPLRVPQVK